MGAQFTWGRGLRGKGLGGGDESVSEQGFGPGAEAALEEGVWDTSRRGGPGWLPSPLPFDPGSCSHPADTLR